ncbi:RBL14 [Scenedesmus sp. PABB004]|nr:RBL14 [Scenedesmus sp. PABB004]
MDDEGAGPGTDLLDALRSHLPASWASATGAARQLRDEASARWRAAKLSVARQLHGSPTLRRAVSIKDEALAHLKWSRRSLSADTRVPLPVEWDSRALVAALELARVLRDHARASDGGVALPPVTAAACVAELLVFFKPGGVPLRDVSLSPYAVIDKGQWYRLGSAALVHVDATHLVSNLTSLLPDAVSLEESRGSAALAADLVLLTFLSSSLYVAWALVAKVAFVRRSTYFSAVTVGASGLAFALKVWAGAQRREATVRLFGVPCPAVFAWLPTLALTSLCVPESSFPAHIAGVVAGLLRTYAIEPLFVGVRRGWSRSRRRASSGGRLGGGEQLQQLARRSGGGARGGGQLQDEQLGDWRALHRERWLQQQSGGGAAAGSSRAASSSGGGSPPSAGGSGGDAASLQRLALEAGLQLCFVATAVGAYVLMTRGTKPSSMPGSGSLRPTAWWR